LYIADRFGRILYCVYSTTSSFITVTCEFSTDKGDRTEFCSVNRCGSLFWETRPV